MAVLPSTAGAGAGASPWNRDGPVSVRMIAAQQSVRDAKSVRIGLQFELQPGWKTYWRTPGDAGIPAQFDWSASVNVADVKVSWPLPKRFQLYGFETFGYDTQVVLPIDIELVQAGKPTRVDLTVQYAACEKVCVPMETSLAMDLAAGSGEGSPHAALIARFASQVPATGQLSGIDIVDAQVEGDGRQKSLIVRLQTDRPLLDPDIIVEAPGRFLFSRPEVQLFKGSRGAEFRIAVDTGKKQTALADLLLTVTVHDHGWAMERRVQATAAR